MTAGAVEPEPEGADALPLVTEPFDTADLPATPRRDARMPAALWTSAPAWLVELGRDLGHDIVAYKRSIHGWSLWRAGPARHGEARYAALDPSAPDDPERRYVFRLHADGSGFGLGPGGSEHTRFRTWKEALRNAALLDPTDEAGRP